MNLIEFAKENMLVLDGAMGTMLQSGYAVREVHLAYLEAGANVILTNTFHNPSNADITAAVQLARDVATGFAAFVVLDIAPSAQLLEPLGDLTLENAYADFKRQVLAGAAAGVDAIYIETMTDLGVAECAVRAAKENCELPIFCTMSFEANMHTFMGTDIPTMASRLTALGVDFLGINCSVGPGEMKKMAAELMKWTHLPIIIKPNAGLPRFEGGKAVYDVTSEDFAAEMAEIADMGVAGMGGCCGTRPEFIRKLSVIAKARSEHTI